MQGIRITPHPILMRFNSHTYMYDTSQCECEKPLLQLVSIHAPAWGATGSYDCSGYASSVSIHAPAWGATLVTVSHINGMAWFQFTRPRGARLTRFPKLDYFIGFNSRARVGRDIIVVDGIIFPVVSIHAPAWGATALSGPNGNQWITYAFPRSY